MITPSSVVSVLVHPVTIAVASAAGAVFSGLAIGGVFGAVGAGWLIGAGTGVYDVLAIGTHSGKEAISLEHWKRVRKKLNETLTPDQVAILKAALANTDPALQRIRWMPNSVHSAVPPHLAQDVFHAITLGKVSKANSGPLANVFGKIGDVMAPFSEAMLLVPLIPNELKLYAQLFAPLANDIGEHLRWEHKLHVEEVEDPLMHNWSRTAVGVGFVASGIGIGAGLNGEILTIPLVFYAFSSEVFDWQIKSHEGQSYSERFDEFRRHRPLDKARTVAGHVYAFAAGCTTAVVAMAQKAEEEDGDHTLGQVFGSSAIIASIVKVTLDWIADRSRKNHVLGELSETLNLSAQDLASREMEVYHRVMDWSGVPDAEQGIPDFDPTTDVQMKVQNG